MTVLGVIGSGTATAKIINDGLAELRSTVDEDADFWFLTAYPESPGRGLSTVAKWVADKTGYYELVIPTGAKFDEEFVSKADKTYRAKNLAAETLKRLEDDADTDKILLVLYSDDDEEQDDVIRQAISRDIRTLDLTNALEPFELEVDEDPDAEPEADDEDETPEEPEPVKSKKAASPPPPPAKGKPGRPRKVVEPEPEAEVEETTADEPEETPEPEPEPAPKRTRGRAAATSTEPVEAEVTEVVTVSSPNSSGIDYVLLSQAVEAGVINAIKHLAGNIG